jgi:glycerol uptake facilitator-like aquaporin
MLRRIAAEGIGSLLLAATVIGSGIMAERLAAGNLAVALIANTGATVAVLATLIALLGPVSGAHFNPAVSLVQALCGALPWREAAAYVPIQVLGCCAGAVLAHAMFSLPLIQTSLSRADRHRSVGRRVRGDPRSPGFAFLDATIMHRIPALAYSSTLRSNLGAIAKYKSEARSALSLLGGLRTNS